MHERARRRDLRPALEQAGLPTDLADAASDDSRDKALRAEAQEAADRCGGGVGTPILSLSPPAGARPARYRDRPGALRGSRSGGPLT